MKTAAAILFCLCAICSNAHALSFHDSRAEKFSISLLPTVTNSKLIQFDNGAEADISKRTGFAFTFGYNFNHHFELGMLFHASDSNYTGTRVDENGDRQRFSANLYTSTINIDFTYNLLKSPFTPYLNAFLGTTYIDSGIPTGNITTGCWWDPWGGYICTPVAQTYTANRFNYGVGAGLRYDFNRHVYVKGGVIQTIVDLEHTSSTDFISYQFGVGFMF